MNKMRKTSCWIGSYFWFFFLVLVPGVPRKRISNKNRSILARSYSGGGSPPVRFCIRLESKTIVSDSETAVKFGPQNDRVVVSDSEPIVSGSETTVLDSKTTVSDSETIDSEPKRLF